MDLNPSDQAIYYKLCNNGQGDMAHPTVDFHGDEGLNSCTGRLGRVNTNMVYALGRVGDLAHDRVVLIPDST